ncbi:MAG: hypothetical protein NZ926_02415 [Candidatus Methanomethylicia archaeon]|nr:hypothetical protein [Candidatus Methanomethylicia archaeon]MCX8169232.1 hypothetical protein [Candidatus Methanomethylicia archaeon]MDW7988986.1 hypothetical protein [Nitrososphaerota archaeon]
MVETKKLNLIKKIFVVGEISMAYKCPVCGEKTNEVHKCEMCFKNVCRICITEREEMKVCVTCARFMDMIK